ncbi:MAG: MBL fold metallo-hydrolase, partial [Candidatus Bathyarchaeia archaeon]
NRMISMGVGDTMDLGGVNVVMVKASHHQSKYPAGYIVTFEGKRIYHPGDTYLDGIRRYEKIDIMFVPVGGNYTMNVDEAVEALKIVRPTLAIPMHYNTFPEIKADPEDFKTKAEKEGFKVKVMEFGEQLEV